MAPDHAQVLVVENLDTVAAMILGGLTGHARRRQRAADVAVPGGEFGNTDTRRYLQRLVAFEVPQRLALVAEVLSELQRGLLVGVRQQDAEVVAGQPRYDSAARQILFKQSCESDDNLVTRVTPEGVVHQLQVIQVQVNQLMRIARSCERLGRFL